MKRVDSISKEIIMLCGIVASAMIFFPILGLNNDVSYTGIDIVFGKSLVDLGILGSGKLVFNVLALFAFLLPLSAILFILLFKRGFMVATVLFVIAITLLITLPNYVFITVDAFGTISRLDVDWTMQIALIGLIVFSGIGFLFSLRGSSLELGNGKK